MAPRFQSAPGSELPVQQRPAIVRVIVIGLLLSLSACMQIERPLHPPTASAGPVARLGLGLGSVRMEDSDGHGFTGALRGGLAFPLHDHFEFDVRVASGATDVHDPIPGFALNDYRARQQYFDLGLRSRWPIGSRAAAYIDAFAGYGLSDYDVDIAAGSASVLISDNGHGPSFGAGTGFQFHLDESLSIGIGIEWRQTKWHTRWADFEQQDLSGVIEFSIRL